MRAELHRRSIAQMKVSCCFSSGCISCHRYIAVLVLCSVFLLVLLVNTSVMQINNRSVQDMHVFGDPSRIPIVIMERVLNAPRRTFSENSYFRHLDLVDSSLLTGPGPESGKKQSGSSKQQTGRELKIVVFVHGFQASHFVRGPLNF